MIRQSKAKVLLYQQGKKVQSTQMKLDSVEMSIAKKSRHTTLDFQHLCNAQCDHDDELKKLQNLSDYAKVSTARQFMITQSEEPLHTSKVKRKKKQTDYSEDLLGFQYCDAEDSDFDVHEGEESGHQKKNTKKEKGHFFNLQAPGCAVQQWWCY